MFQESSNYTNYMNVIRLTLNTWVKTADSSDYHFNLYASLRSLDKLIDNLLISERIDLHTNITLATIFSNLNLAGNLIQNLM